MVGEAMPRRAADRYASFDEWIANRYEFDAKESASAVNAAVAGNSPPASGSHHSAPMPEDLAESCSMYRRLSGAAGLLTVADTNARLAG
jgi:hypothetical protein